MADETLIAGADGCRSGWILAVLDGGAVRLEHVPTGGLGAWVTRLAVLAIDIPIGLPSEGSRACDLEARQRLPGAGSRVFPAPRRAMLGAGSYKEACEIGRGIDGKALSRQAWAITPKIKEVDALWGALDEPGRVREVHPEVSFGAWAGKVLGSKHSAKGRGDGREERLDLVNRRWSALAAAIRGLPKSGKGIRQEDALDACAALWTAERILCGEATALGGAARDASGRPMEIVY